MNKLFWINLPYACFGIITKEDKVTQAAPIANWMMGKSVADIEKWVESKKGEIKIIPDESKVKS